MRGFSGNSLADGAHVTQSRTIPEQILDELPFLRRVVRRWQTSGAEAEDLVQEALVKALANAYQWTPGTNLRAWLFTIMRNQFLAGRSKANRARAALESYGEMAAVSGTGSQYATVVLRDVERVVERMPKAQRVAIRLVGLEGRSHEEVARELGLSTAAVRCHLARARHRLREAFDMANGGVEPAAGPRRAKPVELHSVE